MLPRSGGTPQVLRVMHRAGAERAGHRWNGRATCAKRSLARLRTGRSMGSRALGHRDSSAVSPVGFVDRDLLPARVRPDLPFAYRRIDPRLEPASDAGRSGSGARAERGEQVIRGLRRRVYRGARCVRASSSRGFGRRSSRRVTSEEILSWGGPGVRVPNGAESVNVSSDQANGMGDERVADGSMACPRPCPGGRG